MADSPADGDTRRSPAHNGKSVGLCRGRCGQGLTLGTLSRAADTTSVPGSPEDVG
jgi:hypothetical protein